MLADVLATADDWPTQHTAVGVTDLGGTVATHGATDAVLPVASVTKPVFALGLLIAVEDGAIHLDEPAGPAGSTVRHLLAHASGLGPDASSPTSEPETRRAYSNHGYELLGELLEERTGVGPGAWLADEVFTPLGMADSALDGSPAHAMTSTVDDLLTFARELLSPALVDEDLVEEMLTVQFPLLDGVLPGYGRQSPNPWGLGPELRGTKDPHWTGPSQPSHTAGHFGQSGSFLWVDRALEAGVACLTGTTFGDWAVAAWAPFNQSLYEELGG